MVFFGWQGWKLFSISSYFIFFVVTVNLLGDVLTHAPISLIQITQQHAIPKSMLLYDAFEFWSTEL